MADDTETQQSDVQRVDGTAVPSIPDRDGRDAVDQLEDEMHYRLSSGIRDTQPIQLTLGESARRNDLSDHERLMTIDAWMTYLRNDYQINRALRYADPYSERREVVRERDDYECQICGTTEADHGEELQVHHITPPEVMDDESLRQSLYNLLSACKGCHLKIEGMSRIETLRRCRNPEHLRPTTDE